MFQLKCDDNILYDPRSEDLIIGDDATVSLETNKAGSMTFSLFDNHPYYNYPKKLKSIFELRESRKAIFRGIMTNDPKDWNNTRVINLQGVLTFFNDSIVEPFSFPEDFIDNEQYIAASQNGNVVEFLLAWLIESHNSQVEKYQQFKIGKVTVTDPNNYISRSSESYQTTWNALSDKLFNSSLGGFLCIRYEDDGNYIDYLAEFELTNPQPICYGENLIDLSVDGDASELYTAILPIGAEIAVKNENSSQDEENTSEDTDTEESINTESEEIKYRLTLAELEDGEIDSDIVKKGKILYSKSAVEKYGFICKNVEFNDVTLASNLLTKAKDQLQGTGIKLENTIEIHAYDLHYSDSEVASFRINRKTEFQSIPHKLEGVFDLTKIQLPILKPQEAKFTLGATVKSLSDFTNDKDRTNLEKIENVIKQTNEQQLQISEIKNRQLTEETRIINDCQNIILDATKKYVETGAFESYQETVSAALQVLADNLNMSFQSSIEQTQIVNGELQKFVNTVSKYFEFGINGLSIKSGDINAMQLQLDNDIIEFIKNGIQKGWWDGEDFHTGNIVIDVTKKAQFGNFGLFPRSDGSLSLLRVDSVEGVM